MVKMHNWYTTISFIPHENAHTRREVKTAVHHICINTHGCDVILNLAGCTDCHIMRAWSTAVAGLLARYSLHVWGKDVSFWTTNLMSVE